MALKSTGSMFHFSTAVTLAAVVDGEAFYFHGMTVSNAFSHFVQSLKKIYDPGEAENIARLVFEDRAGLSPHQLVLHGDEPLSEIKANDLAWKLLRLLRHEPVQYVLGFAWFYHLKLKVNLHVLIPRPETEELAEWIVADNKLKQDRRILDVGTGSGCLALALKKEMASAEVWGIDISENALAVAEQNAQANALDVKLMKADALSAENLSFPISFNLLVSNPPYIRLQARSEMDPSVVNYEPALALFVPDDDPLIFYRAIIEIAKTHLDSGGAIYFEIDPAQAEDLVQLLSNSSFESVELRIDISGKPRMIRAKKP